MRKTRRLNWKKCEKIIFLKFWGFSKLLIFFVLFSKSLNSKLFFFERYYSCLFESWQKRGTTKNQFLTNLSSLLKPHFSSIIAIEIKISINTFHMFQKSWEKMFSYNFHFQWIWGFAKNKRSTQKLVKFYISPKNLKIFKTLI